MGGGQLLVCDEPWTVDPQTGTASCAGSVRSEELPASLVEFSAVDHLSAETIAGYFSAGFVVMGTGMAIAMSVAVVVRSIWSK